MVSRAILVLALAFAPALAGCLTSESVIRLRADGSGTIETIFLINEDAMAGMGNMLGGGSDGDATSASSFAFDAETLQAQAAKYGEGVRLVSSEPMARGPLKGARMIYAFDDVNALRVEPDPSGLAQSAGPGAGPGNPLDLRLTRQPNGNVLLSINFQDAPPSSAPAASTPSGPADGFGLDLQDMPPGMEAMIAEMFSGFRIAMDIEVEGAIVRTSSPFVSGSRVTLIEMDLGTLLKDKAGLARLTDIPPGAGVADVIPRLKDVQGIKVNESPLTIEFAAR